MGIYITDTDNYPVIRENKIRLQSDSGIGIKTWHISNAVITENQFLGQGQAGIAQFFYWPELFPLTDNNTIRVNKMGSFDASLADYLFIP